MGRVLPRRAEDDERVGLYAGDGIAALSDLKGRYTLVKIDADTAIEEDKLGPQIDSTHMSGTVIVTVSPTGLGASDLLPQRGAIVDLVLSPRGGEDAAHTGLVIQEVVVLDVKASGRSDGSLALIAIPRTKLDAFSARIGNSTVDFAQPVH